MRFNKYISISLLILFTHQFSFGQTMPYENHYPRIEIYTEQDYADQSNWSDHTTDPSGRTVYMGKRISEPFIDRTTYLISPENVESLLNNSLVFFPYFKEEKSNITLASYFKLDSAKHLPEFKKQFPFHLEGFKAYPEDDRFYFSTIIDYQKTHPRRVEVVWLNENQWYVNHVFYALDLDSFKLENQKILDEKLVEGTLQDFIRFSNIIQPKLSEGMNYLRITTELPELNPENTVLIIALTPGGPGSNSFEYTLEGNGELSDHNRYHHTKLAHYKVVEVLIKSSRIDFEGLSMNPKPQPFVHDGQSLVIRAWSKGMLRNLTYGSGGEPIPSVVNQFYDEMYQLMQGELFK